MELSIFDGAIFALYASSKFIFSKSQTHRYSADTDGFITMCPSIPKYPNNFTNFVRRSLNAPYRWKSGESLGHIIVFQLNLGSTALKTTGNFIFERSAKRGASSSWFSEKNISLSDPIGKGISHIWYWEVLEWFWFSITYCKHIQVV